MSLMESAIFIARRVVFVASALFMYKGNAVLSAIAIFMISSLLKLIYIISVKPYESKVMIWSESFNELFVLLFAYLAYVLVDQSVDREQILSVGLVMQQVMYVCIVANLIFLVMSFCADIRKKIKTYVFKKVLR